MVEIIFVFTIFTALHFYESYLYQWVDLVNSLNALEVLVYHLCLL